MQLIAQTTATMLKRRMTEFEDRCKFDVGNNMLRLIIQTNACAKWRADAWAGAWSKLASTDQDTRAFGRGLGSGRAVSAADTAEIFHLI